MTRGMARALRLGVASGAIAAALAASADPMQSFGAGSFGLPGLIDMPTAESAPDGTIGGSVFRFDAGTRITLTFQVTRGLSGAFRYSKIPGVGAGGETLYDRSFDLHYQLFGETALRPAIAIGLRDFVGTGVYSSEYVVATKSVTPRLRLTAGLGWGRLASLGGIGSPFGSRPTLDFGEGGKANDDQWFRGEVAPFAGIAWQASDRLTLKAEYSSDDYAREEAAGSFDRKSPFNFGADYRIGKTNTLSAYYLYGSEIGVQFSVALDPHVSPVPSGIETAPLPVRPRPSSAADPEAWSTAWVSDPTVAPGVQDAVARALEKDGQRLESMALSATRVEVRVRNERYGAEPEAIGRTARILTRALPASVETFVITPVVQGIAASAVTLRRSDVEALEHEASGALLARVSFGDALRVSDGGLSRTAGLYPRLQWSAAPYVDLNIFDPDDPLRGDAGLRLGGRAELMPGLIASGAVRQKVLGNLDEITRKSDSVIQHVRSDLAEYQKQDDPVIEHLTLAAYARPAPDLYARLTVGYLERMFGGVSGEVLWKRVDSPLALGVEVNYTGQRNFDQLLGFQDYEVATGHASAYYDLGKGFLAQIDVGRYLAKDWGATFTLDREFANGVRVGAFATVTDLSSREFGEGSFDKGIRVTIPLGWATGRPSTGAIDTTIRPLNRDGGARLAVDGRLYETIRGNHQGELSEEWGRVWR